MQYAQHRQSDYLLTFTQRFLIDRGLAPFPQSTMGTEALPESQKAETNPSEVPPCWGHSRVQCGRWIGTLPTLFFQPFLHSDYWMGIHRSNVVEETGKILVHLGGNTAKKNRHYGAAPTLGKGRRMDWETETSSCCRVRDHIKQHTVEPMRNKNIHRYSQPVKVSGPQDTLTTAA